MDTPRRSRRRWRSILLASVAALVIVVAVSVAGLSRGDLGYAWRVLSLQDSSTSDVEWKRSIVIPSAVAEPWPEAVDCAPVDEALDQVGGLEQWMRGGGGSAFVAIQSGILTCEWYGDGIDPSSALSIFSISKSVMALLLAQAVESGTISSVDTAITEYVPELAVRDARFADITLRDLIDMRSGIAFDAITHFPWLNQDSPRVYYASDLRNAVIEFPMIESGPGPFTYNDYAANLIGLAIERAQDASVASRGMPEFWAALGAQDDAAWLVDDREFPWHESGLVASARDLAKVGSLLLNDPSESAPEGFFAGLNSGLGDDVVEDLHGAELGYANGWWVLDDDRAYIALGRWGQVMVVVPEFDTIIVRLGVDGFEAQESNPAIAQRLVEVAEAIAR